jgi:regulatory protein
MWRREAKNIERLDLQIATVCRNRFIDDEHYRRRILGERRRYEQPYTIRMAQTNQMGYSIAMQITALQQQATNAERTNIFADGQFLMGANALIVLQLGLKIGQELTSDLLAQLRQEEALQKAVDRALNYLSFRPRSREEVRRYLKQKETPVELIEVVMERLERMKLVDDASFASFWIENREHFSPRGARALKNELRMKGVEREVIEEAVTDDQDEERAMRAGEKKARTLARQPSIDFASFRNKLGSFLQRRGFGYDVTSRTVRALWETVKDEQSSDDQDEDEDE